MGQGKHCCIQRRTSRGGWTRISKLMATPTEAFETLNRWPHEKRSLRVYDMARKLPVLWPAPDYANRNFLAQKSFLTAEASYGSDGQYMPQKRYGGRHLAEVHIDRILQQVVHEKALAAQEGCSRWRL